MTAAPPGPLLRDDSTWVRLRTLINLRWLACSGQLASVAAAERLFDIVLPLGACLMAIGASVIVNLLATFVYPENKRLTERETVATLMFDLGQLAFLLFLTGGLHNPFALLVIAPVTISATALGPRSTVTLGAAGIALVTLVAFVHLPLRSVTGTAYQVPRVFEFGFWLSIVIGIVFLAIYSHRVAAEIRAMSRALLATQMALDREQKLTDLGGVVAAAAHELGTPLATIKLVSTEMLSELESRPESGDLAQDAALIRAQADRCRDILRSMGRVGKDDLYLRTAPLDSVLREATAPHAERGRTVHFAFRSDGSAPDRMPVIRRAPEVIHGLRNLAQNAVDFARSAVWIEAVWSERSVAVRIVDDGPGFPPHMLGRIGEPFLRSRPGEQAAVDRPGYEGMGLGLFIAKTLLERSGAEVSFANAADPFLKEEERPAKSGALVEVVWPVARIVAPASAPLGQNQPIRG